MAGETETIPVSPGVELEITKFSDAENKLFDRDYPKLIAMYTKFSRTQQGKAVIVDILEEAKEAMRLIGQASKRSIQPTAGVFQGMRATTGFGFGIIRPDHIVPTAQGRTFDGASVGAKDVWEGLWHNGAVGAAYNANPLYVRKEMGLGLAGVLELAGSPTVEEMQLELNGKPLPVYNMLAQMRGADIPAFKFPAVEYLKPAMQYRCQAKWGVAQGTTALMPLGVAFVTAEFMRNIQPTQPSIVPP